MNSTIADKTFLQHFASGTHVQGTEGVSKTSPVR